MPDHAQKSKAAFFCAAAIGCLAYYTVQAQASDVTGSALDVSLVTGLTYDSNVFARADAPSDTIVRVGPRVALQRNRGVFHLNGELDAYYDRFLEKGDNSAFGWSVTGSFNGPHRDVAPLYVDTSLSYDDSERAQSEIGRRVRTRAFNLGQTVSYVPNRKIGGRFTATLGDLNGQGTTDSTRWSLALSGLYEYSQKLALVGGFRYQAIIYDQAADTAVYPDNKSHAVYIGAEGDLLPKVTGSFSIGAMRVADVETGIYYNLSLTWAPTQKIGVSISGSRDNSPSLQGYANLITSLQLVVSHQLTKEIGYGVSVAYSKLESSFGAFEFEGNTFAISRTDDSWSASCSARYTMNDRLSLALSASFSDRDSNIIYDGLGSFPSSSTFSRWLVSFTSSFRF